MKEIRLEYKKETGNRPEFDNVLYCDNCDHMIDTANLYNEEYVEWLEDKYEGMEKELKGVCIDWKSEYDDAVYEIGQLQDQLENAEDEIRDLNYEIKIRPQ